MGQCSGQGFESTFRGRCSQGAGGGEEGAPRLGCLHVCALGRACMLAQPPRSVQRRAPACMGLCAVAGGHGAVAHTERVCPRSACCVRAPCALVHALCTVLAARFVHALFTCSMHALCTHALSSCSLHPRCVLHACSRCVLHACPNANTVWMLALHAPRMPSCKLHVCSFLTLHARSHHTLSPHALCTLCTDSLCTLVLSARSTHAWEHSHCSLVNALQSLTCMFHAHPLHSPCTLSPHSPCARSPRNPCSLSCTLRACSLQVLHMLSCALCARSLCTLYACSLCTPSCMPSCTFSLHAPGTLCPHACA